MQMQRIVQAKDGRPAAEARISQACFTSFVFFMYTKVQNLESLGKKQGLTFAL